MASITWDATRERQMNDHLRNLQPVHAAHYDAALSSASTKRVGCTRGTRVELLEETQTWTRDRDGAKIYWMNGMAGTGKTTIAYTMCAILQRDKRLGASFFCSRNSPDCRDVTRIVPTIAYQLGRFSNPFRQALCDELDRDPDFAMRSISTQFKHLISTPLTKAARAIPKDVVVVIDALDECADVSGTRDVLKMLLQYADNLPIKFFVSSRPEPAISDHMTAGGGALRSILWLHDIEKSLVQADIRTYLTEALESVQITPSELDQLAVQAGNLFIFAATAVRYIIPEDVVDHQERLQTILDIHSEHGSKRYHELDGLYQTILSKALGGKNLEHKELERRRCVLWTAVCAREPMSPATLSELLDVGTENQLWLAIQPLQSVLHMSASTDVVSTLHASFPDFLLSPERSGAFHCNPEDHHSYLAVRCFTQMKQSLRFNICNLETSYQLDRDVPDLDERVAKAVSAGLFYACRYWSSHLASSKHSTELLSLLDVFLKHRLLFWMEVLNLKTWIHSGEVILSRVVDWLSKNIDCTELRDFAHDARNFVTTFAANPCSLSTPHIYITMLPLTSRQSYIWRNYWPRTQGLLRVEGPAIEQRARSALVTWDTGHDIACVARSNDGKRIVFGSGAGEPIVSIWDVSSGSCVVGPLRGHVTGVSSTAFSPDDACVASGSLDNTIYIWDANQGHLITNPLRGHSQPVTSVVFSSDGTRLASGSYDCTIRIWEARTGTAIDALGRHQGAVNALAASPNGKHLASGSSDSTIRVWDWKTSASVQGPIRGHKNAVLSVAYSHDGLRLASGSGDCTVRVWDVSTGASLAGQFNGHTGAVSSVSFSPNGTQVVSGSSDQTVRVWETASGRLLAGPFEGHTNWVHSVVFTADGTRILSGSYDRTICIWDARHSTSGAAQPAGHSGAILSVSLSPDGTHIASGSDDGSICIWNSHNGALVAGPFWSRATDVNSIAFSPDGARIVSGTDDHTLRTWDASTGALLVGPIKGHTNAVRSVAFSPDGSQIASGSDDRTVRLWNSHTGDSVSVGKVFGSRIGRFTSIAFSPDGSHIVSGSDPLDLPGRSERLGDSYLDTPDYLSANGHTERLGDNDRPSLLDLSSLVGLSSLLGTERLSDNGRPDYRDSPTSLDLPHLDPPSLLGTEGPGDSDDLSYLDFPSDLDPYPAPISVLNFDIIDMFRNSDLPSHLDPFSLFGTGVPSNHDVDDPLGASPNDTLDQPTVRMWRLTGCDPAPQMSTIWESGAHPSNVSCVAFSPDTTRVVSGSDDSSILVVDARDGVVLHGPFVGHSDRVSSVAFSPDGTRVVSGSWDRTVRVWDAESGMMVAAPLTGHTGRVSSVAFAPDTARVISGSADGTIRIWDVAATIQASLTSCDGQSIDDDGWLTNSRSQRSFWVPSDLRKRFAFLTPSNPIVINANCYIRIDGSTLLGDRWHGCYAVSSELDSS